MFVVSVRRWAIIGVFLKGRGTHDHVIAMNLFGHV
jgi:hypothetical protein